MPSRLNLAWYQLLQRLLQLVMATAYHARYFGRENIPPNGAVLVISNHQSHLDPILVGVGCSRFLNYVARESLFSFAPFGRLIHSVGAFPIDRDGMGLGGIKEALKRLKRGEMVLLFPEGTRSYNGEISPFRPGFTALAVRSKAAILPVAIDGAFRVWPRWRRFPGLGRIRVCYGQPILPSEITGRDERELLAEVERRVHECHTRLTQPTGLTQK
jgi:1-acyl-sn-glycerol-3-phosphate acyltransferase